MEVCYIYEVDSKQSPKIKQSLKQSLGKIIESPFLADKD